MKKVAIYARLAQDGDSEYALEEQLNRLRDRAKEINCQVVREYSEIASGGGQDCLYNPELRRLVEDSREKEISLVLVMDSARISRRMDTCFKFIKELQTNGIKVMTGYGEELRYIEPNVVQQLFDMIRSNMSAKKISQKA